MGIASETVTVDFPIGDVFDFLADGSNNSLWRSNVISDIFAAGPPEKAVWAETVTSPSGKLRKADYRISWYDHPGKLELTVFSGPSRPTIVFELRSLTGRSTEVTCSVDVKPRGYPFERTRFGTSTAAAIAADIQNLSAAMVARRPKN